MKPLRLCMEAFGPFAGQEIIDFGHLKDGAFFLIHGNTGAGKSTILDAICYALYGETSGDERSASDLRCHYADPTQLTRVTFDFQLGTDHYRVIREPEQQRPKQRGAGTTTHNPTAQLWRWLPEFQPPSPIGPTWSNQEVYKKIKELTSLEAQQFRQVVMLPQGRFREVLTANSQVRQGILSQLFGTGQWQRVQKRLKEMTSEANKAYEAAKGHFETLAEQEQVSDAIALQAKTLAQEEQLQACKALAETASEYAHDARGRVEAGRGLAAAFEAFEKAERNFKQLQANIPEMERLAQTLAAATRAEKLQDPLRIRNARQKEAQDAQHKAIQAEQVFIAAQNDVLAAQQAKTKAEQDSLPLEHYKILHQTLKDQLPKVMQWEQLQVKHQQLKSEITTATQKYNDSLLKRSETQIAYERTQDDLRKAKEAATYLPHLKAEHQRIEEAHKRAIEAQKVQRDYKILTVQLEDARKAHLDAKQKAEDADQTSEKRWHTYLNGQAASLAQGLKESDPCPVCGSAQHPHLATFEGHLPSLNQVEEARTYARKQNDIAQKYHTTYLELQGKQQSLHAQADALHSPDAPDTLKIAQQQAQNTYDQAFKTANTQNALAEKLNQLFNLRNETEANVQSTEAQLHQRQGEEQHILGKQEILSSEIAEADRKPGALQKSIDKVRQDITTIETALKKAEENLQRQKDRLLTAQTHLDDEKRDATDLIEKAEAEQAIFLETLQMAGFANEVALQRAMISPGQLLSQKERLAAHQHDYDLAQAQLESRQEAIKNQQKPDITTLLQEMKAADTAEQQAQTAIGQAQGRLQELQQRSSALAQAERARDEKAANYTDIKRLSDVVNGYKPNQTGIDLERFVLGFLLDQVLLNASLRLMRMTHNRFQLQRRKDGDRLHKGLDIEVIDAWSGRERPVQTLSGGEGFQASLALALGLADVAQQQSGGVEISAVFVDEGFGSLDPATLDVAIDTLHLLQEGGRMVGIISHVPELERRIETRLEVKTSPTGSHAVWINKRPEAGVLIGQSEAL